MADIAPNVPQGVLSYIRRFYFDTALSPSPYAMSALKQLVDPSHILFGSDFPFAPAAMTSAQVAALDALDVWSEQEKANLYRANALALFPRLASLDNEISERPVYRKASTTARLGKYLRKPLLIAAERMRNR